MGPPERGLADEELAIATGLRSFHSAMRSGVLPGMRVGRRSLTARSEERHASMMVPCSCPAPRSSRRRHIVQLKKNVRRVAVDDEPSLSGGNRRAPLLPGQVTSRRGGQAAGVLALTGIQQRPAVDPAKRARAVQRVAHDRGRVLAEVRGVPRRGHQGEYHHAIAVEPGGRAHLEAPGQAKEREQGDKEDSGLPPDDAGRRPAAGAGSGLVVGPERLTQLPRAGVPVGGHFRQGLGDHGLQPDRNRRAHRSERGNRIHRVPSQERLRRRAAEGRRPREHLIEDAAQAVDVASVIDPAVARLLRTHVRRRSHDDPGLRELFGAHHIDGAGQSEIRQDRAVTGKENVSGLDVAVDESLCVGDLEGIGDLAGDRDGGGDREL